MLKSRWSLAIALAGCLLSCGSLQAVTISNYSFETPVLADNGVSASIPNWNEDGDYFPANNHIGVYNPPLSAYPGGVPDGNNVAIIFSLPPDAGSGQPGGGDIWQQTAKQLEITDASYSLSAYVGNELGVAQIATTFELRSGTNYATSTLLKSLTVSGGNTDVADGTFAQFTLTWSQSDANFATLLAAHLGEPVIIAFSVPANTGANSDIDLVQLSVTSVPEPASLTLLLPGLLLFLRPARLIRR